MGYLIGTDEAGYGPNLGPLVISASLWHVPDDVGDDDLYERLAAAVTADGAAARADGRLAIADSKCLYHAGGSLGLLEQGVLAALAMAGHQPRTWRDLWAVLAPDATRPRERLPWYAGYDCSLPIDVSADDLAQAAAQLDRATAAADVTLVGLRSRAVFPAHFNHLVGRCGTKGAALSELTLRLVAQLLTGVNDEPVLITCDKHGGRNHYAPLLHEHLGGGLVSVVREGRSQSHYRLGQNGRSVEIRFCTAAERYLGVALASMTSKYLRETAMRAFNQFWRTRMPELRPTAGYPRDARRFKSEIAHAQQEMGLADTVLWRQR